jgi:lipoate-protein ligase A
MKTNMPIEDFWASLKQYMFDAFAMQEYILSPEENEQVEKLKESVYSQWSWNYGASPPHNIRKTRRVEGCGTFEILLDVEKEGIIKNIVFYGDFFGNDDPAELTGILKGHHFEYNELADTICDINISRFFHNLDAQTFLSLLFE